MPVFLYKGRTQQGHLVDGKIEADSTDLVVEQLFNGDITPIEVIEQRDVSIQRPAFLNYLLSNPPKLDDLILFCRQSYTLLKAGVPITLCLNCLIRSTRNPYMIAATKDILECINTGRELSSAMANHPRIFSFLFINMVRVGENTGRLEEAFARIEQYLRREREIGRQIKTALRYPSFVIAAILVAIAVINIWVIPAFSKLFAQMEADLPWQTRLLIGSSDFFVQWWPLMAGGIIVGILAIMLYLGTQSGRYHWDRYKLRLPIIGDIIWRATLAKFAWSFSMAMRSGIPLLQILVLVARAVDNDYIGERVLSMRNGIERGESLLRTATLSNMFSPLVLQMIAVGEETGQIDDMLAEIAEHYEREVDYDLNELSSTIEPILILAMGAMILVLALGVLLPLWDLVKIAK